MSSMVYKGDPCIRITFTQGNTIFPFTQGNTMFPLKNTTKAFSLPPPTPIPDNVGGKSPHTVSHLVSVWHKVPFSGTVTLPYSDPSWSTVISVLKYLPYQWGSVSSLSVGFSVFLISVVHCLPYQCGPLSSLSVWFSVFLISVVQCLPC